VPVSNPLYRTIKYPAKGAPNDEEAENQTVLCLAMQKRQRGCQYGI
jgi:hypothetical protein